MTTSNSPTPHRVSQPVILYPIRNTGPVFGELSQKAGPVEQPESHTTNWHELPIQAAPLHRLVWPCHDIDLGHVHPTPELTLTTGPIHVEELLDGSLFVHDGRHRAIRATLAGHQTIPARIHR